MEYVTVDSEVIKEDNLMQLHFVLKLWMVTNSGLVDYVRWNQNHTYLIVNAPLMTEEFREGKTAIFLVNCTEDFLFLLKVHGFKKCAPEELGESERNELEAGCLVYFHRQFVGSNTEFFNDWLSCPNARDNDFEQRNDRTLGKFFEWEVAEELEEFFEISQKIKANMMGLDNTLKNALSHPGTTAVTIPSEYIEQETIPAPDYGYDIAGNYGEVTRGELETFFGAKLPRYVNTVAEPANPPEQINVEEVQEQPTSDWATGYILPHALASFQQESEPTIQFDDMKEIYESVDLWTGDEDGSVIEIYEISDDTEITSQNEMKREQESVATSADNEDTTLPMSENMTQYLTNCMKALITPIDSD